MSKDNPYRILTPSEFQALKDAPLPKQFRIPTVRRNIWLDTLMFTGMRYSELLDLDGHWTWLDIQNRAITIPMWASKTEKTRTIHLTPLYSKTLAQYLREFKVLELPDRSVMDANLKRWYIGTPKDAQDIESGWYPTCKTFRKSWESWLLFAGYPYFAVCTSQGHSPQISYNYYANLDPRLKSEVELVKKMTEGWMT